MTFRFDLPVEVERQTDTLDGTIAITLQVVCHGGKWRAQCQTPPVATLVCDTLEEALISAVREVEREWAEPAAT